MENFLHKTKLKYIGFVFGIVMAVSHTGWTADKVVNVKKSTEPRSVRPIRKLVHRIEGGIPKWQNIVANESCDGDTCSNTHVWLDKEKHIRKIVTMESSPAAGARLEHKSHTESYFDPKGTLLFHFSRGEELRGGKPITVNENRWYFDQRKLAAWKTGLHWHSSSETEWRQTQTKMVRAGDSEFALVRQQIKNKIAPAGK